MYALLNTRKWIMYFWVPRLVPRPNQRHRQQRRSYHLSSSTPQPSMHAPIQAICMTAKVGPPEHILKGTTTACTTTAVQSVYVNNLHRCQITSDDDDDDDDDDKRPSPCLYAHDGICVQGTPDDARRMIRDADGGAPTCIRAVDVASHHTPTLHTPALHSSACQSSASAGSPRGGQPKAGGTGGSERDSLIAIAPASAADHRDSALAGWWEADVHADWWAAGTPNAVYAGADSGSDGHAGPGTRHW